MHEFVFFVDLFFACPTISTAKRRENTIFTWIINFHSAIDSFCFHRYRSCSIRPIHTTHWPSFYSIKKTVAAHIFFSREWECRDQRVNWRRQSNNFQSFHFFSLEIEQVHTQPVVNQTMRNSQNYWLRVSMVAKLQNEWGKCLSLEYFEENNFKTSFMIVLKIFLYIPNYLSP